jgi:SM-20-related protein
MTEKFEIIANGLASTGFAVCDQFLSQDEVDAILESEPFKSGIRAFRKAGIGKSQAHQINEAIRGDYIQWLDKNAPRPEIKLYLDRLSQLREYLNVSLYLSLKDYEVHLTIYPAGAYYKRHLDQFRHDDHRKLSVICYLNHNWHEGHGGQLRMFVEDGALDFLPVAGRLVCFRSDRIEHEVLPSTRERMSLTGWMLDQFADLRHL